MASVALQKKVVSLLKLADFLVSAKCRVDWEKLSDQMGGKWGVLTIDEVRELDADGWKSERVERLWDLSSLVQSVINLQEVPPYVLFQSLKRVRLDFDRMLRAVPPPGNKSKWDELRDLYATPTPAEQDVIDVVRENGVVESQRDIQDLLNLKLKEPSVGTIKKVCADLKRRGILVSPKSGKGYTLGPVA